MKLTTEAPRHLRGDLNLLSVSRVVKSALYKVIMTITETVKSVQSADHFMITCKIDLMQFSLSAVRNPKVLCAALIVVVALGAPDPRAAHIDDAFITFRYARSLLRVPASATTRARPFGHHHPLYTFLMAGLGAVSGGVNALFPYLALWVNALADAATACC